MPHYYDCHHRININIVCPLSLLLTTNEYVPSPRNNKRKRSLMKERVESVAVEITRLSVIYPYRFLISRQR